MLDFMHFIGYNHSIKAEGEFDVEKEKIDRINVLARKSKSEGLTENEKSEQKELRDQYIREFRMGMRGILDNTVIRRPDGTEERLKKNEQ